MLGADYDLLSALIDKMVCLLEEDAKYNSALNYNLTAFKNDFVREQILSLFQLAASECEHFAIRDILGAFSFIFTACTIEEYSNSLYFTAIFEGTNELLKTLQQFDPILLSQPSLDEELWNGKVKEGWIFSAPEHPPIEIEDVDEAYARFKTIKRQYYFENINGKKLATLQPDEITECTKMFTNFESQKKKIKGSLIRSLNKLFLPSSDDRKQLHIWTTHKYDMSQEAAVAVSSKAVDAADLEIQMPRPADWLSGLEYVPDHIILIHIHPLCVPKIYKFNPINEEVEIRPASEGGIFTVYSSIIEKLNEHPSAFSHTSTFFRTPLKRATYVF